MFSKLFPRRNLIWSEHCMCAEQERLVPMTYALRNHKHLFAGKSVLDLGSNAGHFPLAYAESAAYVMAVEGRKRYEKFWRREVLPRHPHAARVTWRVADVREFVPPFAFDVVSCLGLIYHVQDGWQHFERILAAAAPSVVFFDSMLWKTEGDRLETSRSDTNCLKALERVPSPSKESVEQFFRERGWRTELLLENWHGDVLRGMWVCR